MTPDHDDDLREELRRRAASITPRGTYADLEAKLAAAPHGPPRWQRPLLMGVAAVLALLVGAGVVALAADDSDGQRVASTGGATAPDTSAPVAPDPATTAPPTTPTTPAPPEATTTSTAPPETTTTVPTVEPLSDASQVGLLGIGLVELPTTIEELTRVTGQPAFADPPEPGSTCSYLKVAADVDAPGIPSGITFMVDGKKIVRVDVRKDAKVLTISGAGIGTTEKDLLRTYPEAEVRTSKYSSPEVPIQDVVVTGASSPDHELLFEVTSGVVTSFRAGLADYVELYEGCS